jgi:hypothetical protein
MAKPIASPARGTRARRSPGRALKCWLREIVWAGGWVVEAAGVDGWFWIVDGCKRPETAVRRVEEWARAGGFAIAWRRSPALDGARRTARSLGRARGLRCRITRWGGAWVAEGVGPADPLRAHLLRDRGSKRWLHITVGRKRPETLKRRVDEWARASGIAVAWEDGTPGVADALKRRRPTRR